MGGENIMVFDPITLYEAQRYTDKKFAVVNLPNDFVPKLPFNLIRQADGTITHDYNLAQFTDNPDVTYYVRDTGDDTDGDGSLENPFATLAKALEVAVKLAAGTKILINCSGCNYITSSIPNNHNKIISVVTDDEFEIVPGPIATSLTWTTDGGAYKTTLEGCSNVIDRQNVSYDNNGVSVPLVFASDKADCQSTSGTWWTDGTDVYINTIDSREPDSDVKLYTNNISLRLRARNTGVFYFRGIRFGGIYADVGSSTPDGGTLILDSCYGEGGGTSGILSVQSLKRCFSFNCHFAYGAQDGCNYHYNTPHSGTSDMREYLAFEFGCTSYNNGILDAGTSHNASSAHEGVSVLRVNGNYGFSRGPTIADVHGCYSVNINCLAESRGVFNAWYIRDNTKMVLINCIGRVENPTSFPLYILDTAEAYLRGFLPIGGSIGGNTQQVRIF